MSQLSKNQLKAENQSQFPNNNVGAITPSHLRAFNVDLIDSTVNQTDFTSFSGSVASEIDALQAEASALENVSASLIGSASNALTTASFDNGTRNLTFTKGNSSTFAVNIPASTIDTGSFVTTSSFEAFTASADSRLDNIEAATSSYITNAQTASMTVLSASFAVTAAFALNSTTVNTGSLVTTASFNAYTQSNDAKVNSLIAATASFITESETGSFARVDASNTFTQNNSFLQNVSIAGNLYVSGSEVIISSSTLIVGDRIIEVNANKAIGDAGIYAFDAIGNQTGSLIWNPNVDYWLAGLSGSETRVITAADTASMLSPYISSASVAQSQLAQDIRIDGLSNVTSSYITSAQTASMTVLSASFATTAAFALNSTQIDTGSFVTTSSFNPFSASVDSRLDNLEAATGSYITAAQTASMTVGTASLAQNALDIVVNVKNTTGVQINKGTVVRIIGATGDNPLIGTASWQNDANSANTLGFVVADIANDAFGRVMTQGTLLGVNTDPALGYAAGQLLYLSSSGQYTNVKPPAPYHEVRLGQVLRAQQNNGSIYVSIQNGYELDELHDVDINTGSLVNNDLLVWNSASAQWVNKTLTGIGGLTTASFNAATGSFVTTASFSNSTRNITFTKGDNSTFSFGGLAITGSNTFYGAQKVVFSSSIAGPYTEADAFLITGSGYTWITHYNDFASSPRNPSIKIGGPSITPYGNNVTIEDVQKFNVTYTGNVDFTVSGSGVANINHYGKSPHISWYDTTANRIYKIKNSGSVFSINEALSLTDVAILEMTTSSVKVSGSSVDIQGTLTASLQQGFTYVGGANGRTTLVATASFATTGSNAFFGNNSFSGSLAFTGSAINLLSASTSGTVITNLTDTFTDVARVDQIVTLTSASYASLVTGSLTNPNTLYIVSGSTSGSGGGGVAFPYTGDAVISGSLQVTGSMRGNVGALTVASSTASISMTDGNFFTLTLPTGSTTRVEFTNIRAGQTINLQVTQGSTNTGSIAFASNILFAGGFDYTATAITGAIDLLSFVTFNTSSVIATAVKNLL